MLFDSVKHCVDLNFSNTLFSMCFIPWIVFKVWTEMQGAAKWIHSQTFSGRVMIVSISCKWNDNFQTEDKCLQYDPLAKQIKN